MKTIGLFCGASKGLKPDYRKAAEALVDALVEQGIAIVYGGGNVGLMGIVADRALALGGWVTGVIPRVLIQQEQAHQGLSELILVDDMHERKKTMSELADGFITLSGGSGSMDELFQEITLRQVGHHNKISSILNTAGYYDHLLSWLEHSVQEGFFNQHLFDSLIVDDSPANIVRRLKGVSG
ncbi:TIGR00730 family Rossman fold protein [Endozoicomonas sp.]|uniref:LOG family protein n=1 Tax=Endozoicomonas sp. TaxID=1892382 RepID=UPI002885A796|nr:TIGR00730 family Rossman fold protein [Endozoicomonas sp.]